MHENEIGTIIVDSSIAVHREFGPGIYETVHESALEVELRGRGLRVERQVPIFVEYKGVRLDEGFRADMIVERKVVLELKSVENVSRAHKKQIRTYLRLTGCKLGYLLNFGEELMKDGIFRVVNGLKEEY